MEDNGDKKARPVLYLVGLKDGQPTGVAEVLCSLKLQLLQLAGCGQRARRLTVARRCPDTPRQLKSLSQIDSPSWSRTIHLEGVGKGEQSGVSCVNVGEGAVSDLHVCLYI